jgi:hypothetical protein
MVLLPNQHLGAMERLAERASASPSGDGGPGTRMFVTGQVTVYHNLNYFLPSAPPLVVRPDDPSASPATPTTVEPKPDPAAAPMPTQPAATGAEPSIDEIVSRLDKAASSIAASVPLRAGPATPSTAPATTTPSTSDADASRSGAAQPTLAAGVISHRRGRIARGADGALAFTFDSGTADAPAGPLLLVPSQTLMAIEALAERAGEAATYTVSGEVSVYRGRNHLLVRSYRINRPTDQIMPTQ